jgi:hypothetical protein
MKFALGLMHVLLLIYVFWAVIIFPYPSRKWKLIGSLIALFVPFFGPVAYLAYCAREKSHRRGW